MPTQTCECIKVTYQLVGGEPVTVEVVGTDLVDGKYQYNFTNGVSDYTIVYDAGEEQWYVEPQTPNTTFLSTTNSCPFGTYTIEEGSIFEAFVVQPCETETEEDRIINCYRLTVWKEQCEYAKCVLKYLTQLQFGINNCEALEKLKNKRRVLNILNCYDPRDILNNTTEYNSITYTEIKQLLNYL